MRSRRMSLQPDLGEARAGATVPSRRAPAAMSARGSRLFTVVFAVTLTGGVFGVTGAAGQGEHGRERGHAYGFSAAAASSQGRSGQGRGVGDVSRGEGNGTRGVGGQGEGAGGQGRGVGSPGGVPTP